MNTTLNERLNAIHILRCEYSVGTLCRVLKVNPSDYYTRFSS